MLNNLELKGEALHAFNLPFHVKKGFIGKLHLIVPWQVFLLFISSIII